MTNAASLRELGEGFCWHLRSIAGGEAKAEHVRQCQPQWEKSNPIIILPESAVFFSEQLSMRLKESLRLEDANVLMIDADPMLTSSILESHAQVTAYQCHKTPEQLGELANESERPFTVLSETLMNPLPEAMRQSFDVAIVDTLYQQSGLAAALCRGMSACRAEARCAVLVHPLERDRIRQITELLGIEIEDEMHECIARVLKGPHLGDVLWDVFWCRGDAMRYWVPPDKKTNLKFVRGLDPDTKQHGCLEMHDISSDVSPDDLAKSAATWALLNEWTEGGSEVIEKDGTLHGFWAYHHGCRVVLSLDQEAGRLACQLYPWSPHTHLHIVRALLEHLPQGERTIRFLSATHRLPENHP